MEETTRVDLQGIADKGFVRFSVKAEDTPQNIAVHSAFKQFCADECDNNYTLGLRKLLENYEQDARFSVMWDHIGSLRDELEELKAQITAKKTVVADEKREVF